MSDSRPCKSCKANTVIHESTTGTSICTSCGIEQEFDNFQNPFDSGTFIPSSCPSSRTRINGRTVYVAGNFDYREKKHYIAGKSIAEITTKLGLSPIRSDDVKRMIEEITDGEFGLGDWFPILIGACIYAVVRKNQLPLTISEIASAVSSNIHELGRMFIRVRDFLDLKLPDLNIVFVFDRSIQNCPSFSMVEEGKKSLMAKQGRFLLHFSVKWYLTTGRYPLPMVAAVLAFVAEINGLSVGIDDIAKELNAKVATSKLRYKELKERMVKVARVLPWGKDVTVKSIVKHAPFVLRYMEMKSSASDSKSSNGDSIAIPFDMGDVLSECLQDRYDLDGYDGEKDSKYFDCENHGLLIGNGEKLKLSKECLRNAYVQFLNGNVSVEPVDEIGECGRKRKRKGKVRDSAKQRGKGYMGLVDLNQSFSLGRIMETNVGFNAFPPSFVAGLEASKKRREKIIAAKLRINEVMHARKCKQWEVEERDIDWEDCIIELLLLHRANELEIEQGHYNTLLDLHVFNSMEVPSPFAGQESGSRLKYLSKK